MKPRCDHCAFWTDDGNHSDVDKDDRLGTCLRNAPHPTIGQFEYAILWFLARNYQRHGGGYSVGGSTDDIPPPHWQTFECERAQWPSTLAIHWCGEFRQKRKP